MLREAFERWEHKEVFLKKWHSFVRERYINHLYWEILLDRYGYLVIWQKRLERLEIIFLNHAFTIDVLGKDWEALRDFFLNAIRPGETREYRGQEVYLLQVEPKRVHLVRKSGWRDCIVLSQAEWERFLEVLSALGQDILLQ